MKVATGTTTRRSAGWAVVAWSLVLMFVFSVVGVEEAKAESRIAFTSNRDGNYEIYVMNAVDGSNQTRLTNAPSDDPSPAWSP